MVEEQSTAPELEQKQEDKPVVEMETVTPQQQEVALPKVIVSYAGFWIRLWAYILDLIALTVLGGVGGLAICGVCLLLGMPLEIFRSLDVEYFLLAYAVLGVVYFVGCACAPWRSTWGKWVCDLKIVTLEGGRISIWQSVFRYFTQMFFSSFLYIGFMMIGWTGKKQGLHDMMVGTYVVHIRNTA